jgi:hypothetical protein
MPRVAANTKATKRRKRPPKAGDSDHEIAERRAQAVELRKRRFPYRRIATMIGVSVETAYRYVAEELAVLRAKTTENTAELRDLELDLIDFVIRSNYVLASQGDPKASLVILKASDARRRLLGLDAPLKLSGDPASPIHVQETHVFAARVFQHPDGPQAATELLAILSGTSDASRDARGPRVVGQ